MLTLEVGKCYKNRLGSSEYICGALNGSFIGSRMLYDENGTAIMQTEKDDNEREFLLVKSCFDLVSEITYKREILRAKASYLENEIKKREREIASFKKKLQALNRDLER